MAIIRVKAGWKVDFRPAGLVGDRIRRTFRTRREAEHFMHEQIALANRSPGMYEKQQLDPRKLSDLADAWYKFFGCDIVSGKARLNSLQRLAKELGNPLARMATPKSFLEYRQKRLQAGVGANHLNHELTYLKTMFNKLISVDDWRSDNPFAKVQPLKLPASEMDFLSKEDIQRLLHQLDDSRNPDVKIISMICLATGCRWGEAESLEAKHFKNGRVAFIHTKNKENRYVPISDQLRKIALTGRRKQGPLFISSKAAFRSAVQRAKLELPKGQLTHILRHTFASHFMINGGNILALNKILGHKTIQMTMVYTHLAPDHLEDALDKNPLVGHKINN